MPGNGSDLNSGQRVVSEGFHSIDILCTMRAPLRRGAGDGAEVERAEIRIWGVDDLQISCMMCGSLERNASGRQTAKSGTATDL
jgi:hypothetical protein